MPNINLPSEQYTLLAAESKRLGFPAASILRVVMNAWLTGALPPIASSAGPMAAPPSLVVAAPGPVAAKPAAEARNAQAPEARLQPVTYAAQPEPPKPPMTEEEKRRYHEENFARMCALDDARRVQETHLAAMPAEEPLDGLTEEEHAQIIADAKARRAAEAQATTPADLWS